MLLAGVVLKLVPVMVTVVPGMATIGNTPVTVGCWANVALAMAKRHNNIDVDITFFMRGDLYDVYFMRPANKEHRNLHNLVLYLHKA
jgi:hypothetical protein